MNYTDLVLKLVKKCLSMGADAAEVYLETGRNLTIEVLNSEIETIQESSSQGIGFRVLTKGKMGFSHCNDFSDRSLVDTISRAIAFASLSTADPSNVLTSDKGFTAIEDMYDPSFAGIPMDNKIGMALQLEKLAMAVPGITKSSGAGYGEGEGEIFIANSNGILKSFRASGCSLSVSVVAEKGDQKNTGGDYSAKVFFSDLAKPETLAASAARKALELLDPVMISTRKAAVIFDPDTARSLFGGVLGAVDGERVLQGASFLKDQLNKQFASKLISITDDGTRNRSRGSSPFDGEGVPTRRIEIAGEGILRSFIYNVKTAKRAGTQSTGSASRGGFSSLPGVGTHHICIGPGRNTQEEIISATKSGLLLREVTGYGVDPVTGNFSGGASGLWIENGELVHPVKGVTIAGKAPDLLNAIDMTGNDIDYDRNFASPSIRVAEIQIGGR
jgi:PmbA protein